MVYSICGSMLADTGVITSVCWCVQFARVCCGARSGTVAGACWSSSFITYQHPPTFSATFETCHMSSVSCSFIRQMWLADRKVICIFTVAAVL